ncbi:ArsR family transcriptional regulator [Rhodothalassium salexigens DSM 2132]|uniref:ArsR family transcriptional regulator n=2 Tax=Rhodothalassium salexigens TaxID=1086 RepID=A0A4R2PVQ3_RHOSA|nr:ArsR family transcriptional regulator [Rhodothalassium salexigens DSM 2132]
MNMHEMKQSSRAAADLMRLLSNEHRLMILCQLVTGERSVGALADLLGVRQTVVSQHLSLLRRDGIVAPRRDGQTIYYSLDSAAARQVIETLYRLYCAPAEAAEATA